MKRILKSSVAVLLALLMLFEAGQAGIVSAVEEIDKAINPAEHVVLNVPERFRTGENLFFVENANWSVSEKSGETLYIPIQRVGDLSLEADVTLKIVDLSAKHDVNYTAEIYKETVNPEIFLMDKSIKEVALNADEQDEVEPGTESDLGAAIHAAGGATLVDGKGNPVAEVTATPLDENGNPIIDETAPAVEQAPTETLVPAEEPAPSMEPAPAENLAPAEAQPFAPETAPAEEVSGALQNEQTVTAPEAGTATASTQALRAARNAFTGTTSDRQELSGTSIVDLASGNTMTEEEYNKAMADAVADNYPGREYRLHFAAGEEAKFLVVRPMYSAQAEGDAQFFMLLKQPGEGFAIGEDVNPISVTIFDEDAPEPVTMSLAEETVFAKDGKAAITVTRSGMLNVIRGVMLKSWGGSAKQGDEYSGVGAKLWFPTGITSRTVEIPVWHGTEEKDFYVTITPLNDEQIGTATVHVIIPPAEKEGGDMELMAIDNANGHPFTDPINIKAGYYDIGGIDSETAFYLNTRADVEETSHFFLDTASFGKAYDGMYVHYKGFLNWCDGEFRLVRWNGGNPTRMHVEAIDDGGVHDDQCIFGAWNSLNAPERVSVEAANVDNEGAVWTDSYVNMWVDEVRFIKRQFTVKVQDPELKPLIGVDDNTVLTEYETVLLDNSVNNTRTLWSGDSFALNAKNVKSPLRLVGIEAKIRQSNKDAWYRLATIDGKSSTVTVELNPDVISVLDEHSCIAWSENGKCDHGGKFYKGELIVRPVFDYIDATVDLKNATPDYGTLSAEAPLPNMLWDFGADRAMDDRMDISSLWSATGVAWSGWNHEGHDSFIFEATGSDPYVSVADHAESVDKIRWLKFAAKNLNGASSLQLYASVNNGFVGPTCVNIPLKQDTEWHEYVVDLTKQPGYSAANWKGALTYFRLDPMAGNTQSGSRIILDYMAFFSSEGSANAFRAAANGRVSGPVQLSYHVGDTLTMKTTVTQAGSSANMTADGFFYELHTTNAAGVTHNAVDQHYLNGSLSIQLTDRNSAGSTVDHPYYNFEPTFTEGGNRIAVIVPDTALSKLDTANGIFAESDYYRFTASSANPKVSVDVSAKASNVQWVKLRARNVTGVNGMKLYTGSGADTVNEASGVTIALNKDKSWHEYVVNLTGWSGNIEWFCLAPMEGNTANGSQVQIDYMAFFEDKASAGAFKNDGSSASAMLWDFNKAGGPAMGAHCKANVSYAGAKDNEGTFISKSHEGNHWTYVVAEDILVNDLYEVSAYTKDVDAAVAKWTLSDGSEYYGDTLYFRSNARARDNAITLGVYEGSDLAYMQLSGTVVSSTMNLSAGRSATDKNPVKGAILNLGFAGAVSGDKGEFTLPALLSRAGGRVRYMVSYNGMSTIHEATAPGLGAEKSNAVTFGGKSVQALGNNLGEVRVDTYSTTGAHFAGVTANQYGKLRGGLNAVSLNGQELVIIAKVAPGEAYTLNHETYTENIKEVRLYFQDQYTGETHGVYSSLYEPDEASPAKWSWNEETGEFVLRIYPFDPEHPTEWTYGDVLMAQLTTDKRGVGADGDGEMVYDPVSTGFGVYADPDYKPRSFDFSVDDIAETLQITPGTDEDGEPNYEDGSLQDDDTRYSYGAFPYLGEITAAVRVVSKLVSTAFMSDDAKMIEEDTAFLSDMKFDIESGSAPSDSISFDDLGGGSNVASNSAKKAGKKAWQQTPVTFSMFFTMTDNFYGGVRFMLGAIFTYGSGNQYERARDPKANAAQFLGKMLCPRTVVAPEVENVTQDLIYTSRVGKNGNKIASDYLSTFGGPYFTFSAYFGVYLCYGYVEISKNGGVEKSHEMVFMGAGGFIGFGATVGYTWVFPSAFIPLYINVEAGLKTLFYLGSEADPNKTLEEAKSSQELHGQDFSFNFTMEGRIFVTGTIGIGVPKLLGVRVSVEVGFNSGYNKNVPKWYPKLFADGFGYTMDATFTGTIDLIFTSIDVYSATWPIPVAGGYLYWFQEANRGNKCISYVENGLAKGKGDSDAAKAHARQLINELIPLIDNQTGTAEQIQEKTKELKNYAYDHDIISWVAKNTIEMNKQTGIAGAIINGVLQDDSDPTGVKFHTQPHVNSQWVAGEGELMSAYNVVNSAPIMEDAFHQPNSKIMGIGNNKFLVTFLDDTASRDPMMAATLKWTIYDATNDTWTVPQLVQADVTADSRPALTDAGDKIILSWASATDAKYDALKQTFAAELRQTLGREPEDIEILEAMEADPARVMSIMDIFTAEFSKSAQAFGEITQLTDDAYYDDFPQAVYDEGTKDYIILYYKTAQDDGMYESAGDKVTDLIAPGANPDKTYSVVCYMLYNSQTNAVDTNGKTHEPGWARDYLFPLETSQTPEEQTAFLAQYGGQRFLPSTIRTEGGEYADPPIYDLAVASGLDGLAAFAFTVDKDFNMDTAADRELYMQYYNFETHGTYVPIRVAGDKTVTREVYNSEIHDFEKRTSTVQVEVGTPKLVRNGGSTFLFWREDNTTVRYLNVSELLNAKVAAVANPDPNNESDWTYALRDDGTFETDASTGEAYTPNVQTVEVLSYMTDADIHITDFDFIADDEDNLYVVWTDVVSTEVTNEFNEEKLIPSQEIFVSAMVQQETETATYTDELGTHTDTSTTARWSKPYRLTRDNAFNDGLALALDDNGGLIIVHNQFTKQVAESEEEMMRLIAAGKIGITSDKAGNYYAASLQYNSPIRMMVTRCDKVGSLEATAFDFSDELPVPGQVISVQAVIENMGVTDANGFELSFYECKDGVKGKQIGETYTSDETIPVNTASVATVLWTVPEDGPEGYSIIASVREKNGSGYYDAVETQSDAFRSLARFSAAVNSITQDGDQFLVDYTVKNTGNKAAPEGCQASLHLMGLYGDLDTEKYGNIEDGGLYSTELSLPAKTAEPTAVLLSTEEGDEEVALSTVIYPEQSENVRVSIPASVFRFCGYDGVQLTVTDPTGETVAESDTYVVRLAEPMNLSLNEGEAISLRAGSTKQVSLSYDTNVFIEGGNAVYTVDDPTVATVDSEGNVKAVGNGTTTLTATLLPSGKFVEVPVTVSGGSSSGGSSSGGSHSSGGSIPAVNGNTDDDAIKTTLSGNTATIVTPTKKQITDLVAKAGTTEGVTFDLSALPENIVSAVIPAGTVREVNTAMMDGAKGGLTVRLPNSAVTLNGAALSAVSKQTGTNGLKVSVVPTPQSSLNKNQRDAIKDLNTPAVYDVYLSSGNQRITDIGGGTVSVAVSHPLAAGQKPEGVSVWRVTEAGKLVRVPATVNHNSVMWTVTDFGEYVIAYADPQQGGACPKDSTCPISAFFDAEPTQWYHDGIHWALENGIMNGVGNGRFNPDGTTSRAMIVTILHRMEGEPKVSSANPFTDVKNGQWYTDAIIWAAENNVVGGYGNGKFGPDDAITREQLAAILYRYAQSKGQGFTGSWKFLLDYPDASDVSDWANEAMYWMVMNGVIGGKNGKLLPTANATRAEAATMLQRFCAKTA